MLETLESNFVRQSPCGQSLARNRSSERRSSERVPLQKILVCSVLAEGPWSCIYDPVLLPKGL